MLSGAGRRVGKGEEEAMLFSAVVGENPHKEIWRERQATHV